MPKLLAVLAALIALVCCAPAGAETPEPAELAYALRAVAINLPAAYGDPETDVARSERLELLAEDISVATVEEPDWPGTRVELAAALLTKAWFESRLSRRVHEGGARRDHGGYAISLWSLHSWRGLPYAEWKTLGGIEGTPRAARAAARVLTWARNRCGAQRSDWVEATFALFATGKRCRWSGSANRAWMFRRVLRQLEAAA